MYHWKAFRDFQRIVLYFRLPSMANLKVGNKFSEGNFCCIGSIGKNRVISTHGRQGEVQLYASTYSRLNSTIYCLIVIHVLDSVDCWVRVRSRFQISNVPVTLSEPLLLWTCWSAEMEPEGGGETEKVLMGVWRWDSETLTLYQTTLRSILQPYPRLAIFQKSFA